MEQIKAIYKISQILSKAFKDVNDVCAHSLADRSMEQQSDSEVKILEKKPKHEKSQQRIQPKQQLIKQQVPNKDTKKYAKKETSQTKINYAQKAEQQKQKEKHIQHQNKPKAQQKSQKAHSSKGKQQHHPDRPKQPLTAFFIFQKQQKDNVKQFHPNSNITDTAKIMGQIWRGLEQTQRAPYLKKHEELRAKYEKQLKKFLDKHPEQKSKKQIKREKAQNKKKQQKSESESEQSVKKVVQKDESKSKKKAIVIEQEESESV